MSAYTVQIYVADNWVVDGETGDLDTAIKIAEELSQFMPSRVMDEKETVILWDSHRV